MSVSLAEVLPFGNLTRHLMFPDRFQWIMGLPDGEDAARGLQPADMYVEMKWLHEDQIAFRGRPFNVSVFYLFDQLEAALAGGPASRWALSLAYWAEYYDAPAVKSLVCPLGNWTFPASFKAVFGRSPTAQPSLEPTGYPSVPPTPVPTGDQWVGLNVTTNFGAAGGDVLTFTGTGFDPKRNYTCKFQVDKEFGKAVRNNLRVEVYSAMRSDPARPVSANKFECVTPAWGALFPGQEAKVMLETWPDNYTVAFNPPEGFGFTDYVYDFYSVAAEVAAYPDPALRGGRALGGEVVSLRGFGLNPLTRTGYQCIFLDEATGRVLRTRGAVPSSTTAVDCATPVWGEVFPTANVSIYLNRTDEYRNCRLLEPQIECSAGTDTFDWSEALATSLPAYPGALDFFFMGAGGLCLMALP